MRQCRLHLELGKRELARHNPERALKAFERALNVCPVDHNSELSKAFYYLGLTLLRLGRPNGAVRSFRAGTRLQKRSCFSRKMLLRFGNDYGMARQETPEQDDWTAFYAIHLQRYLSLKRTQRIATEAEGDMIRDLIRDYWSGLTARRLLESKSPQEKISLFRSVEIVFPFLVVPEALDDNVISVDFRQKVRMAAEDRCRCGSGMPFMMCCGRTRGVDELVPGTF